MNKRLLLQRLVEALELLHQGAVDAAMLAYNTATHEENVAENKYDTLGLEAAYLAQGQAQRVAECATDLSAFRRLTALDFSPDTPIAVGALITLNDRYGAARHLFFGPAAGGLKLAVDGKSIMVITAAAPLGQVLSGRCVGDEVSVSVSGQTTHYEITALC